MAQLKKILLVDDDDDLRDALSEQLVMTEDLTYSRPPTGTEQWNAPKRRSTIWSFLTWACQTRMAANCAG